MKTQKNKPKTKDSRINDKDRETTMKHLKHLIKLTDEEIMNTEQNAGLIMQREALDNALYTVKNWR